MVTLLSLFGQLTEPVKNIYYEDNELRVQSTFVGVLGPPRLDVFQKIGLFEIRVHKLCWSAADIDSVRVEKSVAGSLVMIYHERYGHTVEFAADTIRVGITK